MRKILNLFFLFFLAANCYSQVEYKIDPSSVMTITGTSTIHDWTSKAKSINGKILLNKSVKDKNLPQKGIIVEILRLIIPVKNIESPHGVVMDDKTYEALKSDQYPIITFTLTDNKITQIVNKTAGKFKLAVSGDLTIAGFTKSITLIIDGERMNTTSLRFVGSFPLKMTEYYVTPPTAMFGQIVTGDQVTIDFNILLKL